jgi:cell shape-determining protein MreC
MGAPAKVLQNFFVFQKQRCTNSRFKLEILIYFIDSNNILPIETKNNNILELQGLLKHNGFINTLATKIIHRILIYVSNKHN